MALTPAAAAAAIDGMSGSGLSFDYDRDAWAVELGWQLGYLEFFAGNRNFEGTELGDQIRQREVDWTRAIKIVVSNRGMTPLAENYENFAELRSAVFVRLGDERLKALALIGTAAARLSSGFDRDEETASTLIASAKGVLGQISPFHVADRDQLLATFLRARARTPVEAATALSGFVDGAAPAAPMTFDYDRDLWAIDLGTALGSLEFAFRNHNFEGTALGEQVRASERKFTSQVESALTGRGLGPLKDGYHDFGELASDVLGRIGDERIKALALIGVCVARLRVALGIEGESRGPMLATARGSLDTISNFHLPDRDELFDSLVNAAATTAAEAGTVLAARMAPPPHGPSEPNSLGLDSGRPTAFISYARQDLEAARRLARDLKSAGVDVWIDVDRLRPGERWRPAVSAAIEKSQYFIAVLSSRSVTHRGYVQAELREALDLLRQVPESETFVIPVRLDDADIVNRDLRELNWVDLFPDWAEGIRSLISGLGAGSAESVSATVVEMSPGVLMPSLFLGWQLGRYEIIQGNELPEAKAAESALRSDIEALVEQRGGSIALADTPAGQVIRQILGRAVGHDLREHGAILIGIAAFRANLVGHSSNPANNEELRRLAFSALLDVDPSVVPNKHALFDRLLSEQPASVADLARMLHGRPLA
jgi:hypothetical protein